MARLSEAERTAQGGSARDMRRPDACACSAVEVAITAGLGRQNSAPKTRNSTPTRFSAPGARTAAPPAESAGAPDAPLARRVVAVLRAETRAHNPPESSGNSDRTF